MKVEDGKCAAHGKLYTALPIVSLATKNHNFELALLLINLGLEMLHVLDKLEITA